jgi:hypothetical protein
MHTHCFFLWSIMKIATGHVRDSKYTRVKIAHIHPATWNLSHWFTIHSSPIIYRYFALPQLLYSWRHQAGIFSIPPRRYFSAYACPTLILFMELLTRLWVPSLNISKKLLPGSPILSVRPHVRQRLLPSGVSLNFIFELRSDISRPIPALVEIETTGRFT